MRSVVPRAVFLSSFVAARFFAVALVLAGGAPVAACSSFVDRSDPQPRGDSGADAAAVAVDTAEAAEGVPSRGRDPAVVLLDLNGEGVCSGTLVAEDVVLTARRCVSRVDGSAGACPGEGPTIVGDRPAESLRVLAGDALGSARLVGRGAEIVVPPVRSLCDADIAFVVLDGAAEGIAPGRIAEHGIARGAHVRIVGFGAAEDAPGEEAKRYRDHVQVVETRPAEFEVTEIACRRGAGGPALDEKSGAVVGLVARSGPSCEAAGARNVFTRTDAFRPLFLEAMERAAARRVAAGGAQAKPKPEGKPKSDVGAACTRAEDCAAGLCVTVGLKQYCSRPCGGGDRCPAGFNCKSLPVGMVCIEK